MARPKKTGETVKTVRKPRAKKAEEPKVTEQKIEEKTEDPVGIEYVVTVKEDSWLNVRSGPGKTFSIVDKLKNEDKVLVFNKKRGFGKISIDNELWVCMDFLKSRYF